MNKTLEVLNDLFSDIHRKCTRYNAGLGVRIAYILAFMAVVISCFIVACIGLAGALIYVGMPEDMAVPFGIGAVVVVIFLAVLLHND